MARRKLMSSSNLGRLKTGDDKYVLRELRDVVEAADEWPVKVILETCLLTREEKIRACQLVVEKRSALRQNLHRLQHRAARRWQM